MSAKDDGDVDVFSDVSVDHYRGVTVKTSSQGCRDVQDFSLRLERSLKKWSDEVGNEKQTNASLASLCI